MRHLTFLGAVRSGFRAGQLMVGLGQGAQGPGGDQQDTTPRCREVCGAGNNRAKLDLGSRHRQGGSLAAVTQKLCHARVSSFCTGCLSLLYSRAGLGWALLPQPWQALVALNILYQGNDIEPGAGIK